MSWSVRSAWVLGVLAGVLGACAGPGAGAPPAAAPAKVAPSVQVVESVVVTPELTAAVEAVVRSSTFSLPVTAHPTVVRTIAYIQAQTQARQLMEAALAGAPTYRKQISEVLAADDLPPDLFYVAQAESAFLSADLKGKGQLVGLWQFVPSTARHYGLQVEAGVDDRTNVFKSTDAAVRLLLDLQHKFNDWPLTITAFSAGAGIVEHGLSVTGVKDAWSLIEHPGGLPEESRSYLPLVYAHAIVARDPARFGFGKAPSSEVVAELTRSYGRYYTLRYAPPSVLGLTPSTFLPAPEPR